MLRFASAIAQRTRPSPHQLADEKESGECEHSTAYRSTFANFSLPFCHHSTLEDSFNAAFRVRNLHREQGLLFHQLAVNRKHVITKLNVSRFFAIAELLPSW
jgi:hypothetical protein